MSPGADPAPMIMSLWPDGAPGSEGWDRQEQDRPPAPPFDVPIVRNVTQPTLTVYLPDTDVATGAAVIVCPGGAFHFLAYDHEGTKVARWLNARGVAAIVLKYRVVPTAEDDQEFLDQLQRLRDADRERPGSGIRAASAQVTQLAAEDVRQAMRMVRARAEEWGVAPDRVGAMGFSAGARVAAGLAVAYDAETRPSFVAPIYGALRDAFTVPADAPPIFIALASDDAMMVAPCIQLYSAWNAAGRSAELHIYSEGGHGFGMNPKGLPVDGWIERFGEWLTMLGLLSPISDARAQ